MNSSSSNGEVYGFFQFNKLFLPKHNLKFIIILILMIFQKSLSFTTSVYDKLYHHHHHHHQQYNRCRQYNNINIDSKNKKNNFKQQPVSTTSPLHVLTTPVITEIEKISTDIVILDDLIDDAIRLSSRKPIIMQFKPTPGWIWKRWRGTIFSSTWKICLRNILISYIISSILYCNPSPSTISIYSYPYSYSYSSDAIKNYFKGFDKLIWNYLLSLTTFTLTFFLNVSYNLWRKCYELSRRLQGKLNDVGLILACHAARRNDKEFISTYTPASKQILELVSRYMRLFHILTYASYTRTYRPILTPRGMRRLVERGLLTSTERQVLIDADIPATQRHNSVLLWIVRVVIEGRNAGHIIGGPGFESMFLNKIHLIHATMAAIGGELNGRMRLAYAHIVVVLVDVMLGLYPLLAFLSGMNRTLSIVGTTLLTIFYYGLLDLAKKFLDPYDNEYLLLNNNNINAHHNNDPISVDTLIADSNAGSIRWMNGLNQMPFSTQQIIDGELQEYLLPLKGYSVQELIFRTGEEGKKEYETNIQRLDIQREIHRKRIELVMKWKKKKNMVNSTTIIKGNNNNNTLYDDDNNSDNNNKDDGYDIKSIANLNAQIIIAYENQTVTAPSSTTSNNATSTSTIYNSNIDSIMDDIQVSKEIIYLLRDACNTLVSLLRQRGTNNLGSSSIIEDNDAKWTAISNNISSSSFVGNISQYSNYNNVDHYHAINEMMRSMIDAEGSINNVTLLNNATIQEKSIPFPSFSKHIIEINHHPSLHPNHVSISNSYPNLSTNATFFEAQEATTKTPISLNEDAHSFDNVDISTEDITEYVNNNSLSISQSIRKEEEGYPTMIDNHLRCTDLYKIGQEFLTDSATTTSNNNQVENVDDSMTITQDDVSDMSLDDSLLDSNINNIGVATLMTKEDTAAHNLFVSESLRSPSTKIHDKVDPIAASHIHKLGQEFLTDSATTTSNNNQVENIDDSMIITQDDFSDMFWDDSLDSNINNIGVATLMTKEDTATHNSFVLESLRLPSTKIHDKVDPIAASHMPTTNKVLSNKLNRNNHNLDEHIQQSDLEEEEELWFDMTGQDGQEMRLSQLLADEIWDEVDEDEEKI